MRPTAPNSMRRGVRAPSRARSSSASSTSADDRSGHSAKAAARPDCIHAENVDAIKAKLILQGANIPATAEAEASLHQRGVLNIPDFIANAGGVICAAVEYHDGSEADALEQIADKIRRNTEEVIQRSRAEKIALRQAAVELAQERVATAMRLRALG